MKSNKKRGGRTGSIVALCIVLVLTVVLGVLGAAGWSIPPKGLYRVMPWLPNTDAEAWPQVLPLGLDLRGGMYVEYSATPKLGRRCFLWAWICGAACMWNIPPRRRKAPRPTLKS